MIRCLRTTFSARTIPGSGALFGPGQPMSFRACAVDDVDPILQSAYDRVTAVLPFPHAIAPVRPGAGWIATAVCSELVELLDPEPLYLRRPDAQLPNAPKRVS